MTPVAGTSKIQACLYRALCDLINYDWRSIRGFVEIELKHKEFSLSIVYSDEDGTLRVGHEGDHPYVSADLVVGDPDALGYVLHVNPDVKSLDKYFTALDYSELDEHLRLASEDIVRLRGFGKDRWVRVSMIVGNTYYVGVDQVLKRLPRAAAAILHDPKQLGLLRTQNEMQGAYPVYDKTPNVVTMGGVKHSIDRASRDGTTAITYVDAHGGTRWRTLNTAMREMEPYHLRLTQITPSTPESGQRRSVRQK